MNRLAGGLVVLTLAAPALAQTSKPAVKPAATKLGQVLQRAQKSGALKRVLGTRHFIRGHRFSTWTLVRVRVELVKNRLQVDVARTSFADGDRPKGLKADKAYSVGLDGRLHGVKAKGVPGTFLHYVLPVLHDQFGPGSLVLQAEPHPFAKKPVLVKCTITPSPDPHFKGRVRVGFLFDEQVDEEGNMPRSLMVSVTKGSELYFDDGRPAGREMTREEALRTMAPSHPRLGMILAKAANSGALTRLAGKHHFYGGNLTRSLYVVDVQPQKKELIVSLTQAHKGDGVSLTSRYRLSYRGRFLGVDVAGRDLAGPVLARGRARVELDGKLWIRFTVPATSPRKGKAPKPRSLAWRDDAVPFPLAAFVLPAIVNPVPRVGIPLRMLMFLERLQLPATQYMLKEGPNEKGKRVVLLSEVGSKRSPSKIRVGKGGVEVFGAGAPGPLERISAAKAKQILAGWPNLTQVMTEAHETLGRNVLEVLVDAQKRYRALSGHKAFAATFAELVKAKAMGEQVHLDKRSAYTFALKRSPKGDKWMATATPKPGKKGLRAFAVNQDGKLFASSKPFALNDACQIKGGTPLD